MAILGGKLFRGSIIGGQCSLCGPHAVSEKQDILPCQIASESDENFSSYTQLLSYPKAQKQLSRLKIKVKYQNMSTSIVHCNTH